MLPLFSQLAHSLSAREIHQCLSEEGTESLVSEVHNPSFARSANFIAGAQHFLENAADL